MSARGGMGLMSSLRADRSVLKQKIRPGTVKRVLSFATPYKWLLALFLAKSGASKKAQGQEPRK